MNSVAICIPTFNQGAYLTQAVESAFSQTYPNIEVWVSDDCSTDETESIVRKLMARFPDLRYYRQSTNLGISANNNWILSQPTTEFIGRLDSDDFLLPDYVTELVRLLTAYPEAGYVHCGVQEIDHNNILGRIRRLGGREQYQGPDAALRASAAGYRVAANICLFRSIALQQSEYYRPGMNFCEDWDLSVRLADQGWGNAYCSEILANYRVWEDGDKVRAKRKQIELEGFIHVYTKTLIPAFGRRGWEITPLQKFRKAAALNHVVVLDADYFSDEERQRLIELLNILGASIPLRIQMTLMRLGIGPILRWTRQQKIALKDRVKQILSLRQPHRGVV